MPPRCKFCDRELGTEIVRLRFARELVPNGELLFCSARCLWEEGVRAGERIKQLGLVPEAFE